MQKYFLGVAILFASNNLLSMEQGQKNQDKVKQDKCTYYTAYIGNTTRVDGIATSWNCIKHKSGISRGEIECLKENSSGKEFASEVESYVMYEWLKNSYKNQEQSSEAPSERKTN